MKKSILAALMLLAASTGAAQTLDDIYAAFRDKPGVTYMALSGKQIMAQQEIEESLSEDDKDELAMLKNIDSIVVLNLEDCEKSLIGEFEKMTASLKSLGYEVLVNTSEDGERVTILCRMDEEVMRELLVRNIEEEEAVLVRIVGQFAKEDWSKIAEFN